MTDYTALTLDVADGVAHITLTEDQRGNPFDRALCADLGLAANACAQDPEVRAVLITAQGRFFSVGGDLRSLGAERDALPGFVTDATAGFHSAMARFARMNAPLVVAVHAMAAGGGVSFAAGADILLAAESASFLAAYQAIGLAIDGGGSHQLPRLVGLRRAQSFYLRNETWSAEQARDYGLVSDVVADDELEATARKVAAKLAGGPTVAFGEVKRLLSSSFDRPLEAQLEDEARAMALTGRTDDGWEGISAMAGKRKPEFTGR